MAGVREALAAGSTLAELIESNGGDVDAVIAARVAALTEQVNARVEAGSLTQELADGMVAQFESTFTAKLNETQPMGGFADGKGRWGRRGGPRGWGFGTAAADG